MRLLLDSHAVYWWLIGSARLSATARSLILDREHVVVVSAVSVYELESKVRRRRVELVPQELRSALKRNAVDDLAVSHDHAEYAAQLAWHHRDPWDRLLAAQSILENCTLVSVDAIFDQVPVARVW